ncbi:MAG: MFS transporter [Sebaldella sp.]|nr:MFS transporter [Sebaldella sp.]
MVFDRLFKEMFASLYHKNFRYFWFGQAVSVIGGMIQVTALSWYVYKISGSPFLLGLMGVFEYGPVLALTLFAGVFIEKFSKKKILIFTQSLFLVQSLLLAVLVWTKSENYWYFAALAVVAGIGNSIDMPTRQSYFIDLVGKEDLSNAISLNSTTFNLARIIGPAISGIIMKYLGIAECFFINGLSFIPVIYGITLITISGKSKIKHKRKSNVFNDIRAGIRYTLRNRILLSSFLMMLIVCLFSMNTNVTLPVFAKDALLGDEGTYSFLLSMVGVGSLFGALFMAVKGKNIGYKYFLVIVSLALGAAQMLTIFAGTVGVTSVILIIIGFLNLCFLNGANSKIQMNTDNRHRSRVMSIYTLVNTGSTPIGNSLTGLFMSLLGARFGFFMDGFLTMLFILIIFNIYYRHKRLEKKQYAAVKK